MNLSQLCRFDRTEDAVPQHHPQSWKALFKGCRKIHPAFKLTYFCSLIAQFHWNVFFPHLSIYITILRFPLWWRIVGLKSKCRQVDAIDRNTWKCQPQFETIGFYSIYVFIYIPREHLTTVGTHTKPTYMDGENYPFWKLLRRPNMTPSLVENTPFPQTCNVVNSNPLLHV